MQRFARTTSATMLILLGGLVLPAAAAAATGLAVHGPARHSPWAVSFAPVEATPPGLAPSAVGLFGNTEAYATLEEGSGTTTSGDQATRTTAFVYSDA